MTQTNHQELSKFEVREATYTQLFHELLMSPEIQSGDISFRQALEKNHINNIDHLLMQLQVLAESKIYSTIEFYALAMYHVMETRGKWDTAGPDRVKNSMMRLMLKIPQDKWIEYTDYDRFNQVMEEKKQTYELQNFTLDDLEYKIKHPQIKILGELFSYNDTEKLNRFLEILESDRRVLMGMSGNWKSLILATAVSQTIADYRIHYFIKEDMRTPDNVHYCVGKISGKDIAIRYEVCEYVFYDKWASVFDQSIFMVKAMRNDPARSIPASIKRQLIALLGASTREEWIEKKSLFLDRMMENLVYHEISHDALRCRLTDFEAGFMGGLHSQEASVLSIVNEILTEIQPAQMWIKGPIKNMIDVAIQLNDEEKAKQLLFIYLSDAWFYDTDVTFMYAYNDIFFTILSSYLGPSAKFDFAKLDQNLDEIYQTLFDWYRQAAHDICAMVQNFSTEKDGKLVTFETFSGIVNKRIQNFRRLNGLQPFDERGEQGNFWINFFTMFRQEYSSEYRRIQDEVRCKEQELSRLLLARYANHFDGTIREYVQKSMMDKGYNLSLDAMNGFS